MNDEETIYNKLSARSGEPPPNYDVEAGIHYGVLPINSVNSDAMEDVYQNGRDLGYENSKEEAKASVLNMAEVLKDTLPANADELTRDQLPRDQLLEEAKGYVSDWLDDGDIKEFIDVWLDALGLTPEECWTELEEKWSDSMSMSCAESGPYRYKGDGYVIETDHDNIDLFVIKSPYYTLSAQCSPCAPNAGYIKSPGSMKSYCLGPEWFDDEYAKLPYDVYSVETGELVEKAKETE